MARRSYPGSVLPGARSSTSDAGSTILVALITFGAGLAMFLYRHRLIDSLSRRNERLNRFLPRPIQGFQRRTIRPTAVVNIWSVSLLLGTAGLIFLGIGIYQAVHWTRGRYRTVGASRTPSTRLLRRASHDQVRC